MSTVTERHVATVTANDDPERRGRIRVTCPGLMGDDETPIAGFVEPALDWGVFVVPDVGETVEIEVTVSSARDESFKQSAIDQLNPRWRGARFYNPKADAPTTPVHPDFTTNYGKRRGFATPTGHTLYFDDTPGQEAVRLSWRNEAEKLQYLEITDDTVTISIDGGATLELKGKDAATTSKTGDGSKHVAIAEHLQTFWNSVWKPLYDAHVHPEAPLRGFLATAGADPTLVGLAPLAAAALASAGGSPPTPPAAPAPTYAPNITSGKVSIPDG